MRFYECRENERESCNASHLHTVNCINKNKQVKGMDVKKTHKTNRSDKNYLFTTNWVVFKLKISFDNDKWVLNERV